MQKHFVYGLEVSMKVRNFELFHGCLLHKASLSLSRARAHTHGHTHTHTHTHSLSLSFSLVALGLSADWLQLNPSGTVRTNLSCLPSDSR